MPALANANKREDMTGTGAGLDGYTVTWDQTQLYKLQRQPVGDCVEFSEGQVVSDREVFPRTTFSAVFPA